MVRSAIADDYLLNYLATTAKPNSVDIGLILGQTCLGKDYIIHFAKTPPFLSDGSDTTKKAKCQLTNISNVNENWVADHARQATRMLPGGMYILGVFIISPEDLLSTLHPKIKSVLLAIHKQLELNKYLFGNFSNEKLVLNYCSKTQKYSCKCYNVATFNVQPAEIKSLPKSTKWINIECELQIDRLRYLKKNEADWPLQKHIEVILNEIHENLDTSAFLFDGEFKDEDENLENLGKKKNRNSNSLRASKGGQEVTDQNKPMKVSIFHLKQSNISGDQDLHKVLETCGQLRIVGQVVSNIWLQPKMTIKDASKAVEQDIMRSLAARLEMHWYSVTEEENSEDINCVHEPPRRVLIELPNSNIKLSDYLFPGEGAQDAKVSLEELLDIKASGKLKIHDVEGQVDISEYYKTPSDNTSKEILQSFSTHTNKFMYLGLIVAFIILIVSLVVHEYK